VVDKLWEQFLLTARPGKVMIMRNIDHMVCVNCAKRGKTVADDGEKGDENIINYVNNVGLTALSNIDPAD